MVFEINPKYAGDPLYVETVTGLRKAAQEARERRAKGEPPPTFVDNPTPTELLHRRSVEISDESRIPGDSSGE